MEAGTADRTIEDLADDLDDAQEEEGLEELFIEGASGQLSLAVGGRKPDQATVKLRGGSIAVEGQFEKGEEITLVVTARVAEVHFVDKLDKHGVVSSTERRHFARMSGVHKQ